MKLLGLCSGCVLAALIPRRLDPWIIGHLTALVLRLRPEKEPRFAQKMLETLGPRGGGRDLSKEARNCYEMNLEGPWARARGLRKGGWRPEISVEGIERLREGQAAGAGTILWRMPFGSTLTEKNGLWQQGIPLVHLSDQSHGTRSPAWISRKVLAPLFQRTENWNLKERVVIPRGGTKTGAMKIVLKRLLKENAVVSIIAESPGVQDVHTPFLNGRASFAIGAPSLAWKAGSTLLPIFSVREGTARFKIVIDKPIPVHRDMDRKVYVEQAVNEFSQRMQSAIVQFPGSWNRWGNFWAAGNVFPTPSGPGSENP